MTEMHAEYLGNQSRFKTRQVLDDEPTPIRISAVVDNAHGLRELIRRLGDYANMLELDERQRRAFAATLLTLTNHDDPPGVEPGTSS